MRPGRTPFHALVLAGRHHSHELLLLLRCHASYIRRYLMFSGVSLTKSLADLTAQTVLEPRGEKRGREYRLRTEFLEQIFSGLEADEDR